MREPSDRFRLYRANINLPRMPNGSVHEIDDSDGRWKPWIDAGFISPVDGAVSSVEHVIEPSFDGVAFGDLPTDDEVGRALEAENAAIDAAGGAE